MVFPFVVEEELITSSVCKTLGWSILTQLFAKFSTGDILADAAILADASSRERTSVFLLQAHKMDGMAAEKRRLCLSGEYVNMQQFLKDSLEL